MLTNNEFYYILNIKVSNKYKMITLLLLGIGGGTITLSIAICDAISRFYVAKPAQYLVKTGLNIDNIIIKKNTFRYPFQNIIIIELKPNNYTFTLEAMSKEKLEFLIPCTFTIGPKDEYNELIKYSTLLSDKNDNDIKDLIKGIIEGETRVLTAMMTIEDIFNNRNEFKNNIVTQVQEELNQFGLIIYNANIKELEDFNGTEYFIHIRKKAIAEAKNKALMDVAKAEVEGIIYIKEKEKEKRIKQSEYEYDAIKYENEKQIEISKSQADLIIKQTEYNKLQTLAKIQASKDNEIQEINLQKKVESSKILQKTEALRATILVEAQVQAEAIQTQANAKKYKINTESDAEQYKIECNAKAKKYQLNLETEAEQYNIECNAVANLQLSKCNAEGILTILNAQANGLTNILKVNDDPNFTLKYLMIENGTLEKLAKCNADAIQGLEPKITYWNTNNNSNNPMTDLMKNIPPLVDTIYEQTGIKPPTWLASINKNE